VSRPNLLKEFTKIGSIFFILLSLSSYW